MFRCVRGLTQVRASLDVVAECLGTMNAGVRSIVVPNLLAVFDSGAPGITAIIKILHQYHQFTLREVRRWSRLVLLCEANSFRGGYRTGELI